MLYYLFRFLEENFNLPGAGLFSYVSFRAGMALIFSLFISMVIGKNIINYLRKKQIGESIRDLGLDGQMSKKGTPTMGGIIIIIAILVPSLLFGRIRNIYLLLMIATTVWLGVIGFLDDYIKVFRKHKEGLNGKFKIVGQIGIGLLVGMTMFLSPEVVMIENTNHVKVQHIETTELDSKSITVKSTQTTIPFIKNTNFDYADFLPFLKEHAQTGAWILFIIITIFIVTAVSNGANLTDGLDGLAAGSSSIIGITLGVLAYVSSHVGFAGYFDIMFVPGSEELVVFASAFVGATVGFLWYNSYPAQVFMGDTGSLTIGGIIGVFAILIHKEFLLPILCGIFLIENLSVMMQVSYFKYTKKKYGEGRRIFLMSPLHHHYQKKGIPEAKIVTRFWIIGIALAIFTLITLKIR
ncbi:MAG: phospho-N-acetylmuramoyl-pentapeptide-transferase [Paludibacteraceae bacterium]|nr:phospho-N-acetylmuramoyl-pentapeptide-transferase [Paludibacteraceae bacterium]MBP8628055.1 phospho-N-acetylmuramoyl-pentapeptide-transferase [Paludibacteraceae bacterium]MBP9648296.1 phospho-N-acetylmuramoyl-pentapeptide-transferase [Paludibacteraceae bacterium]MBP9970007.1 phospho-N-acetylmuramoyl-pentapeptide-transferase [Paludibacteraceae bacterium]HNZ85405.1 phospho-N-acetylmuramoyl-pentapeptide-transferase [Paludibacteraceae bacterium]